MNNKAHQAPIAMTMDDSRPYLKEEKFHFLNKQWDGNEMYFDFIELKYDISNYIPFTQAQVVQKLSTEWHLL